MKNNRSVKNRKSMKYVTFMLAMIAVLLWLLCLAIEYILGSRSGSFDFLAILKTVADNLIGILPPLIIFNFAYEYFTKIYVSEEISENIAETMMSNTDVIDRFNNEAKKDFVAATLNSMLKKEKGEVVYNIVQPYIDFEFNIRRNFKYFISVDEQKSRSPFFAGADYYSVTERLAYTKVFSNDNPFNNVFRLGFFVEEAELDEKLKTDNYLFRENLQIKPQDLAKLSGLADEEKLTFIRNQLALKVLINKTEASITEASIGEDGIDLVYETEHLNLTEVLVEIYFVMPQLKSKNKFLVSIPEPTCNVDISFCYPREYLNVTVIPFLNGEYNSKDAIQVDGIRNIELNDWVIPMSGAVFIWEEISADKPVGGCALHEKQSH